MGTSKAVRGFNFTAFMAAFSQTLAAQTNASADSLKTRELVLNLFGRTFNIHVTTSTLGFLTILLLMFLLLIAVCFALIAFRRARQLRAANRRLHDEIRERRRAEVEVKQLNEDLEHRVADRTQQLRDVNKELEAFSYSIAHDLKAPLRAISGFSKALVEDYGPTLEGEALDHLHSIARGAQRMGKLIDDLLEFSRQGRKQMAPADIDMSMLTKAIWDEIERTVPERKVECRLKPLPPARGDAAMVRQVWVNLLSNAIKFTERKDNAFVEIGCLEGDAGQNTYYVKDNGAGFDMRYVDKLFGIFQRLHSERDFKGTGVGLAIVQRIVQRHGGQVWAEGKVNEGATFRFTLPAETTHELYKTSTTSN